jgi:hypothetical protein
MDISFFSDKENIRAASIAKGSLAIIKSRITSVSTNTLFKLPLFFLFQNLLIIEIFRSLK